MAFFDTFAWIVLLLLVAMGVGAIVLLGIWPANVARARMQLEEGAIDTLSVLQIQARVIAAHASLIRIRGERLAQRVNLHLALGGSFGS